MCTVCGLPTTHATTTQVVGFLALFFFVFSTFLGAWMVLSVAWWRKRADRSVRLLDTDLHE